MIKPVVSPAKLFLVQILSHLAVIRQNGNGFILREDRVLTVVSSQEENFWIVDVLQIFFEDFLIEGFWCHE